jgi:flagellar hook-length control protein FliK
MQAATQDTSGILTALLQGQGGIVGVPGNTSQATEISGENGLSPFLESLNGSLQQLLGEDPGGAEPNTLATAIQQLLDGQAANNSPGLPLSQGQGLAAGSADMQALLARLSSADGGQLAKQLAELVRLNQQAPQGDLNATAPEQTQTLASVLKQIKLALVQQEKSEEQNPVALAAQQPVTPVLVTDQPKTQDNGRLLAARVATLAVSHAGSDASSHATPHHTDTVATDTLLQTAQRPPVNPVPSVTPTVVEQAVLNMGRDHHAVSDSLGRGDNPLDSLLSLQGAQQGRPAVPAAASDARPAQSFIQTPVSDPQWQQDFSSRVVMLAKGSGTGQAQVAEIRLNPAHMGPVEVRVVINDDQHASVTIAAHHAAVRDAIETSLPRLREMFSSSGLHLADAAVSDQSPQDRQQRNSQQAQSDSRRSGSGFSISGLGLDDESERIVSQVNLATLPGNSALDLYA